MRYSFRSGRAAAGPRREESDDRFRINLQAAERGAGQDRAGPAPGRSALSSYLWERAGLPPDVLVVRQLTGDQVAVVRERAEAGPYGRGQEIANCKLQIANCKLTDAPITHYRGHPPYTHTPTRDDE